MRGNHVSIKGNVTRDMQVKRTSSGANACSWGIAWNDRKKNQAGDWEDVPNYFDVDCFASDKQLGFLNGIKKGARCAIIEGHLVYQSWEKDGQKRSRVVIRVDDPVGGLFVSEVKQQAPIEVEATVYDDEIPF